ncbi:hypothetical protein QYF61_005831 [Mycteria americana]|uniref:Uncharacterized protein n=1 Tax=Mycteria americana TaxID=33587 RepID=A0AAN7MLU0_MYCAM|nr:hypothetical protein QYF61_005831 [Mycteria americana]
MKDRVNSCNEENENVSHHSDCEDRENYRKVTLVERVPWETVVKGKGAQEGWAFFKKEVLKTQEQVVPMCGKTNQRGRRPAWLNRELLLGLRKKKRVYHFWKKGQVTQEEYRDLVKSFREEIRNAKA